MVEWASGASERTFNQSAANGSNEPILPNAAQCTNVGLGCGGTGLVIASLCEILSKHNVNVARNTSGPNDGTGRYSTCVVE